MLVTLKNILDKANKGGYAVGAFNINNMEILQAVMSAAVKKKSPVIISTSEGAIEYAGLDYLRAMAGVAAKSKVPVCLHLDHGRNMSMIQECINNGWTSVMFDGSHFPYDENVKLTKKVVAMARKRGVSVEAELGTIGGAEEKIVSRHIVYTEPDAALSFVKETKVDALAIAIGTSHGAYKFQGESKLDIGRLKVIKELVKIPLVLHGASGVPAYVVQKAVNYGAKLGHPEGVSDEQIKRAIKNGINKINTDTDLRLSFTSAIREILTTKPEVFDPRKLLGPARNMMQKVVEHRMDVFGSVNKA